jgi:hypothetical protein
MLAARPTPSNAKHPHLRVSKDHSGCFSERSFHVRHIRVFSERRQGSLRAVQYRQYACVFQTELEYAARADASGVISQSPNLIELMYPDTRGFT